LPGITVAAAARRLNSACYPINRGRSGLILLPNPEGRREKVLTVSSRPDFEKNSSSPDFGGELFLVSRKGFAIGPHALG
jgi:hypothetical protein